MNNSSDRGDEIIHVCNIEQYNDKTGYLIVRATEQVWVWVVGGDHDDYHNSNVSTWFNWKHRIISNYDTIYCRRLMDFLMTKCWSSGKYFLFLTGQLHDLTPPSGIEWGRVEHCSGPRFKYY